MPLKMSAAGKRAAREAIERAEQAGFTTEAIAEAMRALRPIIGQALNGRSTLEQFDRLLASGNADRARRYVDHISRQYKGIVYLAVFLGGPLLFILLAAWLFAR